MTKSESIKKPSKKCLPCLRCWEEEEEFAPGALPSQCGELLVGRDRGVSEAEVEDRQGCGREEDINEALSARVRLCTQMGAAEQDCGRQLRTEAGVILE